MTEIERLLRFADTVSETDRCARLPEVFGKRCKDFAYCSECYRFVCESIAEQVKLDAGRTCRNLSNDGDVFVCSECRNETHGFMFDDFGCTVGFGLGVGRCPNCGAKVGLE